MKTKYTYFVLVLTVAALLAIGGCGSGGGTASSGNQNVTVNPNPNPVIPADDLTQAKLNSGKLVTGTPKEDCDNSFVLDTVNELCKLFNLAKTGSGDACINQTSSCNSYERQIYAGSGLGPGQKGPISEWNDRGGSGSFMADAAICTLRELSPEVPGGGPIYSKTPPLNIGIGDVVVKQEVGYLDFDRITAHFKGYRKLGVELPVIGKFDAITQNIDLRRVFYGTGQLFNEIPKAGDYPLLFGYGLNISTEEKNKTIEIDPGSFTVTTPIGPFEVSPHFTYKSNTVVADTPFGSESTYIILPDDDLGPDAIKLYDLYGIMPGIWNNAVPPPDILDYKDKQTGWLSQIGLGARGSLSDKLWSPSPSSSGFFSRPDYDATGLLKFESYESRSEEENRPSVYAEASASFKYPDDPKEMLPDWVDGLPGLDYKAYIQVTPTIKAGAAGQFGIALSEGTDNERDLSGEFYIGNPLSRFSALGIYSGVEANASFDVLAELRLYVSAVFDFYLGKETIELIDINPKFPIHLAGGDPVSSKVELASAYSSSDTTPDLPETLDYLKTFKGPKLAEEFINLCYAKEAEVPPEEPPKSEPEKGDVTDLFEYLPCNICFATDAVIDANEPDPAKKMKEPAHREILGPVDPIPPIDSTTPAVWKCDAKSKSGCLDLCKLNKETGEFTVAKNPSQIADSIPPTDPEYSELYPFYKSCMIPCNISSGTGLFDTSCGKGLDGTPPGILPMNPGGGSTPPAPVPVNTNIAAPFSEPMDPASVNTSTFTVSDADGNTIAGDITYNAATYTAIFTPLSSFEYGRTYTATITTGVRDAAGNPLAADYTWNFTTEAYMDTVPPAVTSTSPASIARDIDVNSTISVTFSEAMDESTIHAGTFTVDNGVTGSFSYDWTTMTATFTPSVPLANGTTYTVLITTGVQDISGNPLADNYTWSFLTAAASDVTPPVVSSTNPMLSATAVPIDTVVSATFSEPLDTSTVTLSTFTLSSGRAGNVSGTISFTDGGSTAVFSPTTSLNSGDTYTATITTDVKDLAGNAMTSNYSWNFTTLSAPTPEERTAFVTSVQGNGNLSTWADAIAGSKTGLAAGDAICQARAAEAGLSGTFVAWLSDNSNDAYCRVHNLTGKKIDNCGQGSLPVDAGPWVRMGDGFPFSETIDSLVNDGRVYAPVMYDETGALIPGSQTYLTGTNADGTLDLTLGACYNWTSSSGIVPGVGGWTVGTIYSWTHNYSAYCSSGSWRLLCLETGTGLPLPPFTTAGKKVFVTSVSGSGDLFTWADSGGNRGLAAGDAICQARAAAGGLANSANFKAWLSSYLSGININAKDRLNSNGPWVRLDGVKVADNKTDLIDGNLFTAISQTETGAYLSTTTWTGTYYNGTTKSILSTCDGWTNSAPAMGEGSLGESSLSSSYWTDDGYNPCSTSRNLFCFED